mmetsp:Transcript_7672/g.16880  ORF Transcript_7672/g.16880 Transcript_7672/m.16880 type:complete len:549 (+) Transcript_7672:147-1793(+)
MMDLDRPEDVEQQVSYQQRHSLDEEEPGVEDNDPQHKADLEQTAKADSNKVSQDPDRQHLQEILRIYAKPPKTTAESLRNDKEQILRVIRDHKEGWRLVKHASPAIQADKDIAIAAVQSSALGWKAIPAMSPELRNDREVALEAVKKNAAALEVMSAELRNDRALISESTMTIGRRIRAVEGQTAEVEIGIDLVMSSKQQRSLAVHGAPSSPRRDLYWQERLEGAEAGGRRKYKQDGILSRVVPLTLLYLQQADGLILAQVARRKNAGADLRIKCMLPGTRIHDGEQPKEACDRFLKEHLGSVAKHIEMERDFQIVEEEEFSAKFNLRTKFIWSIYRGHVTGQFLWESIARHLPVGSTRLKRLIRRKPNLIQRYTMPGCSPMPPSFYAVDAGGQGEESDLRVYAWLPPWEYEWLRSSAQGQDMLKEWLSDVDMVVASQRPQSSASAGQPGRRCQSARGHEKVSAFDSERATWPLPPGASARSPSPKPFLLQRHARAQTAGRPRSVASSRASPRTTSHQRQLMVAMPQISSPRIGNRNIDSRGSCLPKA